MARSRRAELEATLAANPDDVATWQVYADVLLEASGSDGGVPCGNDHQIADLAGILEGRGLPALTYLGLESSEWEAELIEALAHAPITRQIAELDLSMGVLHEAGANALVANADRLRHLQIDVSHKAFPKLEAGYQRRAESYEGEKYYFTSVGE